jgi:hypothetical protein
MGCSNTHSQPDNDVRNVDIRTTRFFRCQFA